MTRVEFAEILALLEACWPGRPVRDDAAALWFDDLHQFDAPIVKAAVLALYRVGREFMPNGAQIREEVARQTIDAPPFREAWDLMLAGIRHRGSHNPDRVIEWIAERSATVADWAARCDIREIGMSRDGDTTVYAQYRQHYETSIRRQERTVTHGDLPSAAAPHLAARSSAPRSAGSAVAELVAGLCPDEEIA